MTKKYRFAGDTEATSSTIRTHVYVSRITGRVLSFIAGSGSIEPGSDEEIEAARCAPAGTDLVDISALDRVAVGDELRVDDRGCATAIVTTDTAVADATERVAYCERRVTELTETAHTQEQAEAIRRDLEEARRQLALLA